MLLTFELLITILTAGSSILFKAGIIYLYLQQAR